MPPTRRAALGLLAGSVLYGSRSASAAGAWSDGLAATVETIEARLGGRVGMAVREADTGRAWSRRGDERFALTSTFKALAAAAVLARVDRGEERLDRSVVFAAGDLVPYSPATEKRVGAPGMTLAEICEAAITLSDNTAGNLMLDAIGGPVGLTAHIRSIGDTTTRLDRREPDLNTAIPGDPRDTTTPTAMAATIERLVVGDALSPSSRARLEAWMTADRVADGLLRAGLPKTWAIADKTGAGGNGARAIVAATRPPAGPPVTIAIFIAETSASMAERNAAIAEIGAAIGQAFEF
ncbi:MAG: class A beta-lactamase [Phyllobacteriaceae bacterium]|nr:class A beta-lactamase [Phyllobacteriaceae bacterium]